MNHQNDINKTLLELIPENWEFRDIFINCLSSFLESEKFILDNKNDLNERTISHKLAEYLQFFFKEYVVDCEYNRMHKNGDDKGYIKKVLELWPEDITSEDDEGKTVYPDIIVHKRGNNHNNFIVIEVKKIKYADLTRNDGKHPPETYRNFDFRKLKAFTEKGKLNYRYGIYIEFNGSEGTGIALFENGEKLASNL